MTRPRVAAFASRTADNAVRGTTTRDVTELGADRVVLQLRLDDGRVMEAASRDRDLRILVGPFFTAAMACLPPATTERYWPGT